ncbi:MAG: PSD1 and planctomycete cytochrome C domain-containing protein [Planctomycetia bacterium]
MPSAAPRTAWLMALAAAAAYGMPVATPAADRSIDFARDVLPIFREHCFRCHGPEKQKSGYRLDVWQIALTGGDGYAPNIVPGNADASPLVAFIDGSGDLSMPPAGPRLSARDVAVVREWIEHGAPWPDEHAGAVADPADWWAFRRLVRPPLPQVVGHADVHPIDAFLTVKRDAAGLPAAPAADRRTLSRRLSFDLTGLPPTPDEVAGFVADESPTAYERLVDRLLASPRYGERQARAWMDAIHFAETHGHDQDRIREHAWPYRDYLVDAFNADVPWDRMIEHQVAGDVLHPDDPRATVALGFLAAGPWDESSLRDIREDTLDRQVARYLDRDDMIGTVMNTITSLTVQCARCHDHKFDPIPQSDYYALQAVFAGVERANRRYDVDPQVRRSRQELLARRRQLERRDPRVLAAFATPTQRSAILAWESQQPRPASWRPADIASVSSAEGATLTALDDGSILSGGMCPDRDDVTILCRRPAGGLTALRLEVLTHESLPKQGPGRQDNGNLHLSEIRLFAGEQPLELRNPAADFNQKDWEIAKAIDGNPQTAWGIFPQVGRSHEAIFELCEPLAAGIGGDLRIELWQRHGTGHVIGRFRVSTTAAPPPLVPRQSLPEDVAAALGTPPDRRNDEQWTALGIFMGQTEVDRGLRALPAPSLVYAAASDFEPDGGLKPPPGPRPVHRLQRGDIRQPREEAQPGALECLPDLPPRFDLPSGADEAARRAALARWLVDANNPLTWRSIVNRIWQQHFGRGLAAMPNDFGHMGGQPSHPELLDWLAVEMRDGGRSLKRLHRLIVTSAAYRQSATSPAADRGMTTDPDNRLLWRAPRRRLDAEAVRDAVLAVAGRLDLRMGGPSDRQFSLQPGIHVTPKVDYAAFDLDSDAGRRRSIYRFLFRTLPDPFMDALDCPAGDQFVPVRSNDVTVQQALAMWNDAFMLRHCEHFAARLDGEAASTPDRIARACMLAWGRPPSAEEQAALAAHADRHGLANACRLIFNSNEFMFID